MSSTLPFLIQMFGLHQKTALVTGGSRGIGAMIAQGFVEAGARTFITARNEEECRACAERLNEASREPGAACIPISCDLSTEEGLDTCLQELNKYDAGKLDILVNNAGAAWGAPIEEYPVAGWDKVINLNLRTPFLLTQKLLPLLKEAGTEENPARVINIASVNAYSYSHLKNYAYTASKAGIVKLTEHMAADLASSNVNVNALSPGFFPSKMTNALSDVDSDAYSEMMSKIPRGRPGEFKDAAGAAIYLSSVASSWVTGVSLIVDGGLVARA